MAIDYDRDTEAFAEKCKSDGKLPRNDALKQIVLQDLVADLDDDRTYDKSEIDELVGEHFDDHVLVRRELVNFGYLSQDHLAGTYEVRKRELAEDDFREISRLERHAEDLGILE